MNCQPSFGSRGSALRIEQVNEFLNCLCAVILIPSCILDEGIDVSTRAQGPCRRIKTVANRNASSRERHRRNLA